MTDYFKNLNQDEWQSLQDVIPLIGILIAGADGQIEEDEISWSKKVIHIRSYKLKGGLKTYYEEVDRDYDARFMHFVETLPSGAKERADAITEKLEEINPVLAQLDNVIGVKLYNSFISFAEQVAKASGGIMGFYSINKQEAKLIGLPMIHPIHPDDSQKEEEE